MSNLVFDAFSFDIEILDTPAAPIKPQYPMAFPETVIPEFIRDDVADAVMDALLMYTTPAPDDATVYELEFFDKMGYSDPVRLPPLELEF